MRGAKFAAILYCVLLAAGLTDEARAAGSFSVELIDPAEEGYYFRHRLDPGGSVTRSIVVANPTAETIEVALYPADAYCTAAGGLNGGLRGTAVEREGRWLNPERRSLTLAAEASESVAIEMRVPANAEPGDHFAFVFVELGETRAEGASDGAADTSSVALQVAVTPRFGVLFWETVPGPEVLEIDVAKVGKRIEKGALLLDVELRNSGSLFAKPKLDWALLHPGGRRVGGPREVGGQLLLPGTSYLLSLPITTDRPLIRGDYSLETTLRYYRTGMEEVAKEKRFPILLP